MLTHMHSLDSRPTFNGVLYGEHHPTGFPLDAVKLDDWTSVHSYPMYEGSQPDNISNGKKAIRSAQKTTGKPVLLSEFGLCTTAKDTLETIPCTWAGTSWEQPFVPEEVQAQYLVNVTKAAYELGCLGVLYWCYTDYGPDMYRELPFALPHEYKFGLFREDGNPKPAAQAIRDMKIG